MTSSTRITTVLTASALLVAACGGSDDDADTPPTDDAATAPEADTDTDADTVAEPAESDCAPTSGTFETPDGTTEVSHAIAARLADGAAYTIWLAAEELDLGDVSTFRGPEAEAGQTFVALAITTFNAEGETPPIEPGASIDFDPDFGVLTFRVTADDGDGYIGNNAGASGTVNVTAVGDQVCGDVTYRNDEQTFTATFAAPTKDV